MTKNDLITMAVAILCFAAVWVPAKRGHLWARFIAWGAIVFVMAVLVRLMRSSVIPG